MSNNNLHLGISIPINYMIGSYPVSALYSGQTQIWSAKEPITGSIVSLDDTITLNDTDYEAVVPEVDPNMVYTLKFNSPTLISFQNPIKIKSWSITTKNNLTEIQGLNLVDTSNVTNMSIMFDGCSGLTTLDVSNFVTTKVTNMSIMFRGCSNLTSLDVSNFDTSNVTNMSSMFNSCSGLTSLDLSNFNTSNVTNMSYMFYGCSGLTTLDVSNFDTSGVTNMSFMFSGCRKLTSLDVSNFDTSNVTYMTSMFSGCSNLTSLDVSNFDTSNVTYMTSMFDGCSRLTSLNLSGWDFTSVTNMSSMFNSCTNLTTIIGPITGITQSLILNRCPLTHDSAMVILNGLVKITTTKPSITFKTTTYETLTEAEIATTTAKGWTIKSAA